MRTARIGFIYPDHAAEDDYPRAAATLSTDALAVDLKVAHIYGTDLHAVPELLDLGSPAKLRGGAAQLAPHHPSAVVWACTSGSFVYGPKGAEQQVHTLALDAKVPASSTSFAFVTAARSLGAAKVAVAASYPADVAALFTEFLAAHGIDVVATASAGIATAAEVGTLTPAQVAALAAAHDHPDADALLVPDTAMRTVGIVADLEKTLGKPVLTANQVTIWEGLRIAGFIADGMIDEPRLGTLFSERRTHGRD